MEKEIATHSSFLAWEITWTEKTGGLHYMGLQRVGWNLVISRGLAGDYQSDERAGVARLSWRVSGR